MTIKKLVKLAQAARAAGESIGVTNYLQSGGFHTVTIYVHSADPEMAHGIVATIEAKSLTEAAAKVGRGEWASEPKSEPQETR